MIYSCNKERISNDNYVSPIINGNAEWVKQLNTIKENGEKTITKSMLINNSNLKLIKFSYLGDIKSNIELEQIKSDFTSNKYHFPYYDIENSKITLKTFDEIESTNNSKFITYSKSSLNSFLDTTININLKKVEIEWECDNNKFTTICLVSESDGIIYDNIITNIICMKNPIIESKISNIDSNISSSISQTKSDDSYYRERSLTWSLQVNCSWLFGPDRGVAFLSHTIYGYKDHLSYSTHDTNSYMSVGKSWTGMHLNNLLTGSYGYSDYAYGYYLATPSTVIHVNFGQGKYSIETNFDFYSSIHGSGNSYLSSSEFSTN